jgi:chloramphenicol-sensitive protein RarD
MGAGDRATDMLLLLSGVVTALPLLAFASAARRLQYTTVGFFQYIAPTGHFLLAVFVYGETFTDAHLITFGLIWTALAIFTAQSLRAVRRRAA